ncbi:MAG TPA: hypothetical protein VGG10_00210 [Rhizomicrobium sp.]
MGESEPGAVNRAQSQPPGMQRNESGWRPARTLTDARGAGGVWQIRVFGLVNATSEALKLVFYSELLFFEGRDPDLVPVCVCHLIFDELLQFLMLVGQLVDMSL